MAEPAVEPDVDMVQASPDGSLRRRAVAGVTVVLAVLAGLVVAGGDPTEVVTADGLGTSSGRTSNVAVTDLSTEHWRVELLPAVHHEPSGWVSEASVSGTRLVTVGERTTVFDLAGGEVVGELPPIAGTPLLRGDHLVIVVRDQLLEVDPRDGTIVRSVPLDRDVSPEAMFPVPVTGGYLVIGSERISFMSEDAEIRWSTHPPMQPGNFRTAVSGSSLVISDEEDLAALDLDDGSLRWHIEARSADRGRWADPWVADGLIHTVERHVRADEAGFPVAGVPTARDVGTGDVVWQAERPAAATLVGVRDGVVYATSQIDDGDIARLDAATGRWLSSLPVDGQPQPHRGSTILGPAGLLLVDDGEGGVRAIDQASGSQRWVVSEGDPWSTVVADDLLLWNSPGGVGVVDGATGDPIGRLPTTQVAAGGGLAVSARTAMVAPGLAVDVGDGAIRIDEPGAERWSGPVAVPGGFLVHSHQGSHVLDRHGGRRWSLRSDGDGAWREPVGVVGDRLLANSSGVEGGMMELLDRDGERIGGPLAEVALHSAVVVGELVIGHQFRHRPGMDSDRLVAIRVTDDGPELAWSAGPGGGKLLADDDHVLEVTQASITRRDLADGSILATTVLPRLIEPRQVALAHGTLLAVARDRLVAVEAEAGQLLWDRALSSRITAGPTVAGDTVYVGTADGDVMAFGLDGAERSSRDAAADPVREVVAAHGVLLVVTDRHAFALGPETLPERTTRPEPTEIGTVDVPVP